MRFTMRLASLLTFFIFSTGSAWAVAESPTKALKRTNRTLKSLLKQKVKKGTPTESKIREKIKVAVNDFLDFNELARLALGKHWGKRTDEEKKEFVDVLRELIERNYVKQLRENLDYNLEYRSQNVKGTEARVMTAIKVTKDGRPEEITIEYKMRKAEDGNWMVYDVITDEVSVVRNYRSQFNRIIRKQSYPALVKKMKRKLETI